MYNANGNATTLRKRNGQTVTQTWDNLGRLTARTFPTTADNVQFGYDLRGLRTSAQFSSGAHTITYVWDNAGRLTSTTAGGKTLSHLYDTAGNRTRTTWPDAFYTTTSYDAMNRPGVIKESGTTNLASYTYDDLSRRTTVTLGNGTTVQRAYDAQGAMATLKNFLASASQEVQYTYTRNQIRELKGVTWSNNIYQWTGATVGNKAYTANGLNPYTAVAGAAQSYDASGNLTGDGTWTYGYDLDNCLKTANKTGTAATLAYDAEGRLRQTVIAGATTNLLYAPRSWLPSTTQRAPPCCASTSMAPVLTSPLFGTKAPAPPPRTGSTPTISERSSQRPIQQGRAPRRTPMGHTASPTSRQAFAFGTRGSNSLASSACITTRRVSTRQPLGAFFRRTRLAIRTIRIFTLTLETIRPIESIRPDLRL